jgi:hypothetical protein
VVVRNLFRSYVEKESRTSPAELALVRRESELVVATIQRFDRL